MKKKFPNISRKISKTCITNIYSNCKLTYPHNNKIIKYNVKIISKNIAKYYNKYWFVIMHAPIVYKLNVQQTFFVLSFFELWHATNK